MYLINFQGYRTSDKLPVCIKQVPRAKIPHFEKLSSGRQIPIEFKMQILASEACQGVVKVSLYSQLRYFEDQASLQFYEL